jgi:acyl carrier protein
MKNAIFDVVVNAIAKVMDIPANSLQMESTLDELGMDSLDALQLLLTLDEETGVQVDEREVKKFTSVRSIVEVLTQRWAPSEQAAAGAD